MDLPFQVLQGWQLELFWHQMRLQFWRDNVKAREGCPQVDKLLLIERPLHYDQLPDVGASWD